jgi:hypothetical protein
MATKSRQQYLKEQAAKLPPAQQKAALSQINAAQKSGGISKTELTKLDAQFNTVLYGETGLEWYCWCCSLDANNWHNYWYWFHYCSRSLCCR